jgi:hypothetical protein
MGWVIALGAIVGYFVAGFAIAKVFVPTLWGDVDFNNYKYNQQGIRNWFAGIWLVWPVVMPYFLMRSVVRNEVEKTNPENVRQKLRESEQKHTTNEIEHQKALARIKELEAELEML